MLTNTTDLNAPDMNTGTAAAGSKYMRIASYIWRVAVNIIQLSIVLLLLNLHYSSPFEHLAVTTLIMIYFSAISFYSSFSLKNFENMLLNIRHNSRIMRKLEPKDEMNLRAAFQGIHKEAGEKDEEELNEAQEKLNSARVKFRINSFFVYIVYLICLYNFLAALL